MTEEDKIKNRKNIQIKSDSESAKAEFTHPSSGSFEYEYTVQDATEAGLINKDNWKKNLKAMLRARCTSAGIRMSYPRCLNNMYTADEVQDFDIVEDQPKEEIIECETIEPKNIEADKKVLSLKLRKLDYTTAMIKEFAEKYDLANNGDLIIQYLQIYFHYVCIPHLVLRIKSNLYDLI